MASCIVYVNNPYSLEGPQTVVVAGGAQRAVKDPKVCPITGLKVGAKANPYRKRLVSYIQIYKSALAVVVPRKEHDDASDTGSVFGSEKAFSAGSASAASSRRGSIESVWSGCSLISDEELAASSKSASDDEGSQWGEEESVASSNSRRPSLSRSRHGSVALERPHSL